VLGGETMPSTLSDMRAAPPQTYGQILKSSSLIGGSSVTTVVLGIVRIKAMALLLGPAGVGLLSLYGMIVELAQTTAAIGTSNSGVRQVAEAVGSGDADQVARTITVLRRLSLLLGVLGGVCLIVLARPISIVTFGSDQHASAVAILSIAVTLTLVSSGQRALIQGMRRIYDLAMLGVVGGLLGTVVSVPAVYFLGEDGIIFAVVGVAAASVSASWWYSRQVRIPHLSMSRPQLGAETAALLKLGLAFLASGLMTMAAAYVVRITVLRSAGFDAAGLYQAAWTVGGMYVGFILQAMGADFYPRLTAAARDNVECNRLVNEQAQVSVLLAGPGVIATITFAPLVIALLYSAEFQPAVNLLRWICAGMALRVITWPMGFIILAKGERLLFFLTDAAWTLMHVGLAWACVQSYGLDGAGVAFFVSYAFHGCVVYPLARRLSGFRWSPINRRAGSLFVVSVVGVLGAMHLLPPLGGVIVGSLALVVSTMHSVRALATLVSPDEMPEPVRRLLMWCRLVRLSQKG
jgi:antigen flippase